MNVKEIKIRINDQHYHELAAQAAAHGWSPAENYVKGYLEYIVVWAMGEPAGAKQDAEPARPAKEPRRVFATRTIPVKDYHFHVPWAWGVELFQEYGADAEITWVAVRNEEDWAAYHHDPARTPEDADDDTIAETGIQLPQSAARSIFPFVGLPYGGPQY